jgi:uncharacterized protein (TIGR02391 family)
MANSLRNFERIARAAKNFTSVPEKNLETEPLHPFDERNVHPDVDKIIRKLFDDGHYSQATFEAFKFVDKRVQKLAKSRETGYKLMMKAFSDTSPKIKLTDLSNTSETDEQQGYKFIFSGAVLAIRNPRGHEVSLPETPDQCLDHVSLASLLIRRLDNIKNV